MRVQGEGNERSEWKCGASYAAVEMEVESARGR